MMDTPAIVAVGYNRVDSLRRLLVGLCGAHYFGPAPLVISLDHSGDSSVSQLANDFEWPHGPKRVIQHTQRLGLRDHILSCGDLTQEYGSIALFEDDIVPSQQFHAYLRQAIAQYRNEPKVAGIGLYAYCINEFNNLDFEPVDDGSDAIFLQVAASWGQAWTAAQWYDFRQWYARHASDPILTSDGVPRQLESWRDNSWKRFYIKYLVTTGRYFVFPRAALSTNMATPGTNTRRPVCIYQTPMDMRLRQWDLRPLDKSLARYDVFYEIEAECLTRLNPHLGEPDFDVDLYGTKTEAALRKPRLLSSRRARSGMGFGLLPGAPPIASVVQGVAGSFFHLAARESFGPIGLSRKLSLLRASQVGAPMNTLMFQTLKPWQTELMIARKQKVLRSAGSATT